MTVAIATAACGQSVLPGRTPAARSLSAKASSTRIAPVQPRLRLRNISVLRSKTSVEVHIEASGPVKPVAMVLADPERIVVDLAGVGHDGTRRVAINAGDVEGVRVALFQADPPITRVVVDLAHRHEYRLLPAGSTVILAIDTSPKPAAATQGATAKIADVAATSAAPSESTRPAENTATSPANDAQVPPQPSQAKLQPPAVAQPEATTLPLAATIAVPPNTAELSAAEETTLHQAAKSNKPGMVRSISVAREKDAIEVRIEGTKPLRASASTLSNPERIIIDLPDVGLRRPRRIPVNAADVEAVDVSLYLVNPLVTRVVVNLSRAHPYHLRTSGNSLTVRIETDEMKAADSQPVR